MSQRKLQQEIDRVFKKVKEGLEEFDFIYDKLQDCDNQSQKEKLESDLKKEIKKLQRSREQIKNWMSGSEVKDKKPLIEHRKLIEHEMERFKEVEKIMKTKAFSNEALASGLVNIDPRQKEKIDCADFIQSNIEELERQMESMEAEIDQISSTLKKKKSDSSKQAQIASIEEVIERHKWHIKMLESVLRHLENDNIEVDQINEIKDDILYYVESNQDPNFIEDDTFYDVLGLDEMEDSFAVIPNDDFKVDESVSTPPPQSVPAATNDTTDISLKDKELEKEKIKHNHKESEKEKDNEYEKEREQAKTNEKDDKLINLASKISVPSLSTANDVPGLSLASQLLQSQASLPRTKTPTPQSPSVTTASLLNGGLKPATPIGTPKVKYATVASAALHQPLHQSSNSTTAPNTLKQRSTSSSAVNTPTLNSATLNITSTLNSTPLQDTTNNAQTGFGNPNVSSQGTNIDNIVNSMESDFSFLDSLSFQNLPSGFEKYVKSLDTARERLFEFKKSDDGSNFANKKSQSTTYELKLPSLESISAQLESSLLNCPDSYDSDKPKNYIPTNQYVTQLCFPQEPAVEIIGSTKLLQKLDIDTLAYCFYYHNEKYESKFTNFHNLDPNPDDDYLQHISAKELHNRGWNYHKQLHTWFREDIDSSTTLSPNLEDNKSDNVSWKYFDYKDTWMVRRKADFKFDESMIERGYL